MIVQKRVMCTAAVFLGAFAVIATCRLSFPGLIASKDLSVDKNPNGELGLDVITSITVTGEDAINKVYQHRGELTHLREIKAFDTGANTNLLASICWSQHVESVVAPNCAADNRFVAFMSRKNRVSAINLSNSQVSSVSELLSRHAEIDTLVLDECPLVGEGLSRSNSGVLSLSTLSVAGSKTRLLGLRDIIESSPGLRRVRLSGDQNVASLFSSKREARIVYACLTDFSISNLISSGVWGNVLFVTLDLRRATIEEDHVELCKGVALELLVEDSFTSKGSDLGPMLRTRETQMGLRGNTD